MKLKTLRPFFFLLDIIIRHNGTFVYLRLSSSEPCSSPIEIVRFLRIILRKNKDEIRNRYEIKKKKKKEKLLTSSLDNINLSTLRLSTKFHIKVEKKNTRENFVKLFVRIFPFDDDDEERGRMRKRKKGKRKKKAGMKRVDRRRAFLPGCYRSIKQTSDFPSSSRSRPLSRNFAYIR